jgi:hypothetical protein
VARWIRWNSRWIELLHDDPVTVHKFCSMLPSFVFETRPVIAVEEAVRGELEVMAWRDGLKGN